MTCNEASGTAGNVVEDVPIKEGEPEKQPAEIESEKQPPEVASEKQPPEVASGGDLTKPGESLKSGDGDAKVAIKEEGKKEGTEISKDTGGNGKTLVGLAGLCRVIFFVVVVFFPLPPPNHLPPSLPFSPPSSPPAAGNSHRTISVGDTTITIRPRSRSRTSDPRLGVDLAFGPAKLQDLDPITVGKLFKIAVTKNADGVALKFKMGGLWNEITYREYYSMVVKAAKSFIKVR